jgi:hypothetical protein
LIRKYLGLPHCIIKISTTYLVEERDIILSRPLTAIAFKKAIASSRMNDLVVNAEGEREERARLVEFSLTMPAYGDIVEEDFIETIKLIVRAEQIEEREEICHAMVRYQE